MLKPIRVCVCAHEYVLYSVCTLQKIYVQIMLQINRKQKVLHGCL